MTAPISVASAYQTRRKAVQTSLNEALAKRDSIVGFFLGLIGILAIVAGGFTLLLRYSGVDPG